MGRHSQEHDKFRFRINARTLLRAAERLNLVERNRAKIPVLSMCRIEVRDSQIALTATDLDRWITTRCDADTDGRGTVLISRRVIENIASATPPEQDVTIAVSKTDSTASVQCGELAHAELRLLIDPEDFPKEPPLHGQKGKFTIGQGDLKSALSAVMFCISTEETRYYLNGVFFTAHPENGNLRMVATDGHRLAMRDSDIAWECPNFIAPTRSIHALANMVKKPGNSPLVVKVLGDVPTLHCEIDDTTMIAKTIDGTYPDYMKVIPTKERTISVTLAKAQVMSVLHLLRAKNASRSAARFYPEEKVMRVKSSLDLYMEMEVSAPIEGEGKPFGLNARYLRDFFRDDDVLRLDSADPGHPFLVNGEDSRTTWLVMPMRI